MITDAIKQAIIEHYHRDYPAEQCGFIVDNAYIPVRNISTQLNTFEIDPIDYLQISKLGIIRALVHSHPDGLTEPSKFDRVQMQAFDYPWVITNGIDIAIHEPTPYQLPLLGRDYRHGLVDCYTLFKDYYARELDIIMSDYERDDNWWLDANNPSLYLHNFKAEGFVEVDNAQEHDVLLCRVGRTQHINHAAVFVGDGQLTSEDTPQIVGDSLILHHPYNRQSIREIYGQQWQNRTALIIRHRSLL